MSRISVPLKLHLGEHSVHQEVYIMSLIIVLNH
jgi:hypothetical protein